MLELDPASGRALSALDALFTRQKMWGELADNLDAQLGLAAAEGAQLALMLRLAALRESEMDQVDVAIEGYRARARTRSDERPGAWAPSSASARIARYELVIADLLEPLYRHLGDYQKLIGAHEVQVRRADDAGRKVELLHQIAALYEDAAGDLNATFATYARALKEDPANETTQHALDRVARATGRFADLAQTFEALAESLEDATLASQLTTMAARVYEEDLGNVDIAVALYQRVLEIDPQNLPAAESLERLFRTHERYAGALRHLAAEGRDPRRPVGEEGRALPGRRDRRGRARQARWGDRRLRRRSSSSTPTICAPSTRSSSST